MVSLDCVMVFPRDDQEITRKYPLGKIQSFYTMDYGIVTGSIWGYTSDGDHLVINVWGDFWYATIRTLEFSLEYGALPCYVHRHTCKIN